MRIFADSDGHRKPVRDDPFLLLSPIYLQFLKEEVRPDDLYIHLGDTWEGWEYRLYDSLIAHTYAWRPETNHIYLEGNHERPGMNLLRLIMGDRVRRSYEYEGWRFFHGHDLDNLLDTPQERMLARNLSKLYRFTKGFALARWIKNRIDQTHRDNVPYLDKFKKFGWDKVLWGHTHVYFLEGTIGNPGNLPDSRTILVVEKGTLTEVTI